MLKQFIRRINFATRRATVDRLARGNPPNSCATCTRARARARSLNPPPRSGVLHVYMHREGVDRSRRVINSRCPATLFPTTGTKIHVQIAAEYAPEFVVPPREFYLHVRLRPAPTRDFALPRALLSQLATTVLSEDNRPRELPPDRHRIFVSSTPVSPLFSGNAEMEREYPAIVEWLALVWS